MKPIPDSWKNPKAAKDFGLISDCVPMTAQSLATMFYLLQTMERPIRRVMDLGCGMGNLAAVVREQYPDVELDLIDFSPAMLTEAKKRWPDDPKVTFYEADLEHTKLPDLIGDRKYDAIVTRLALHHLTEPRRYEHYREIFNALNPGGFFCNIENVAMATPRLYRLSFEFMVDEVRRMMLQQGQTITREQLHENMSSRRHLDIHTPVPTQCQWLTEIGFVDVDCFVRWMELASFGGFKPEG